jgi:transcriptional regulator with XRE-family HTH domain
MAEVGKKIKEIRIKKGLSQEDLAESATINIRTIQRIENNKTIPREKTLKLIFNVLDIEFFEQEKKTINKYLIWSSFLTLMIIIGSFIGWFQFTSGLSVNYEKTWPKLYSTNGWKGHVFLNSGFKFYNWLVSICALTIGSISISYSLGVIKKKVRYILGQLIFIFSYLIVLVNISGQFTNSSKYFVYKPGLFIVITATVLLSISFFKKNNS